MDAAALVTSRIIHTRHRPVAHRLERKGLSLWLDLDRLDEAAWQSALFSIGGFNLLSFDERDHGPNFVAGRRIVEPLASYARRLAQKACPDAVIDRVMLLTFPRILGQVFNPISVYRCYDAKGAVQLTIYEVRNTFGDMHSYVGVGDTLHDADKIFHVSPFLPVTGDYKLKMRNSDDEMSLLIGYSIDDQPTLTATLRGTLSRLDSNRIITGLIGAGQFPGRPLFSIHLEAFKLWRKKVPFFSRPIPPEAAWSNARSKGVE
ncbi:MAG TPA: DUF1365 domain-containing protein [Alphaproteobacteria bacterium]|nr:DUF1365 domain-containing protein [Alphaproteobacteria bacterium]